jgi:hypothetical protein
MGWRDLLQTENETIILPWTGGRELRSLSRTWTIVGKLPGEHGWYTFKLLKARTATVEAAADADGLAGATCRRFWYGYLVGDRFATEDPSLGGVIQPTEARCLPRVHLIDDGLDRFARVSVGEIYVDGPLIFRSQEMPLGPEQDVLHAYEDRAASVATIKGVTPALDGAFRMASWQRTEAERRRAELERLRAEEEAKRVAEARRQELIRQLGDGAGRREMAKVDFEAAARAALAVGGAELLDWKRAGRRDEMTVKYRLDGRRFECVCDGELRIVDAGICLVDHRTGIKGDTRFTLESLPAVVREAARDGVLVVFRHV